MTQPHRKLFSVSVAALRFLLPAWIGAAVLYVITSVAEQTSSNFDSVIRDQLATVRFPLYYAFGTAIYVASLVFCVTAWRSASTEVRRRAFIVMALMIVSAIIFAVDYFMIYSPLQALIVPAGQVRTQQFVTLHNWSRHVNEVHLTLTLIAAVLVVLPQKSNG